MKYFNGYTTSKLVAEKKAEIKKLKIDMNRLAKIALEQSKNITHKDINENRYPKQLTHLIEIITTMSAKIYSLGVEIKRERQKIADEHTYCNRSNRNTVIDPELFKYIDVKAFAVEFYNKFIKEGGSLVHLGDSSSFICGFNSLNFYQISDIWKRPQNTAFAIHAPEYKETINNTIKNIKNLGLKDFAKWIESVRDDIQIDLDEDILYIIFSVNEDGIERIFKINFNF